jgi:hypothetical protein
MDTTPTNRRLATEQWLTELVPGHQPELTSIRLSDINLTASKAVQNRDLSGRDQELSNSAVYSIAQVLKDPRRTTDPIVVRPTPAGLIIIDGNHRVHGSNMAKRATIDAYVVPMTNEQARTALHTANVHAQATNLSEAALLAHAVEEYDQVGSIRRVANRFQISQSTLFRAIQVRDGRLRYFAVTGRPGSQLKTGHAQLMAQLDDDQIKTLTPDTILQASVADLKNTVRTITSLPASQRHDAVLTEKGRLDAIAVQKDRGNQPAKGRPTLASVKSAITQLEGKLASNPHIAADPVVQAKIHQLNQRYGRAPQ